MEAAAQSRQYSRYLLATEVLRSSGSLRICALGTSMLPSIWPGDVLNIQNCEAGDLLVGDIAVVCQGDRFFAHRLIGTRQTGSSLCLIMRGDSVPQNDLADAETELLGKVVTIERRGQVILLSRKRSFTNRALGQILSRSRRILNLVLRFYQASRPELRAETMCGRISAS